jgi:hypothetical protein
MVACWGRWRCRWSRLYQVHVGAALDQHHGLLGPHLLGEQGRHDVGLILVGHRDEDVDLVDVLLRQQLLIRRIAAEDDGVFVCSESCSARFWLPR